MQGLQPGFEPGNWWLPSSPELFRLIRNVTWGTSGIVAGGEDIVNRALTLIGGTRVSAATMIAVSSEHYQQCLAPTVWIGGYLEQEHQARCSLAVRGVTSAF